MTINSLANVTIDGKSYNPTDLNVRADNNWSPTWQGRATIPRADLKAPVLYAATNMMPNPSAAVDLAQAVGTNATLVRQATLNGAGTAHGTGFRLNGSTTSADSFLEVGGGSAGGMTLGMKAGQTYTASGIFYLPAALTGATEANGRARSIAVSVNAPSAGGLVVLAKAAAPNTPGQTRVRLTFTVPADATAVWIRWYHGHQTAQDAYWTDLMLNPGNGLEGTSTGFRLTPFFDGDTPDGVHFRYDWTGTPNNSTSTRTVVFVDTETTPIVDPGAYPRVNVQWWYGDPGPGPGGAGLILDVDLLVRAYEIDDLADTVTITFRSDEIRLQDWKLLGAGDYAPGALNLLDMLNLAMRKIGGMPLDTTALIGNPVVPATATVWRVGQSVDDWLRGPLRANNLELYWDAQDSKFRLWNIVDRPGGKDRGISSRTNVVYGVNAVDVKFGLDADAEGYGDAASIIYKWTDAAGASQRKAYISTPQGGVYRKPVVVTIDTPDPGLDGSNTARIIASRRAWTESIECLPLAGKAGASDQGWLQLQLGGTVYYARRNGAVMTANVAGIEWNYPADKMRLGVENVAPWAGAIDPGLTFPTS